MGVAEKVAFQQVHLQADETVYDTKMRLPILFSVAAAVLLLAPTIVLQSHAVANAAKARATHEQPAVWSGWDDSRVVAGERSNGLLAAVSPRGQALAPV